MSEIANCESKVGTYCTSENLLAFHDNRRNAEESQQRYLKIVDLLARAESLNKDFAKDLEELFSTTIRVDHNKDLAFWLEIDFMNLSAKGRVAEAGKFVLREM